MTAFPQNGTKTNSPFLAFVDVILLHNCDFMDVSGNMQRTLRNNFFPLTSVFVRSCAFKSNSFNRKQRRLTRSSTQFVDIVYILYSEGHVCSSVSEKVGTVFGNNGFKSCFRQRQRCCHPHADSYLQWQCNTCAITKINWKIQTAAGFLSTDCFLYHLEYSLPVIWLRWACFFSNFCSYDFWLFPFSTRWFCFSNVKVFRCHLTLLGLF